MLRKKEFSAPARLLIALALLALVHLACTGAYSVASVTPEPQATISTPGSLPPTTGEMSSTASPTSAPTLTPLPTEPSTLTATPTQAPSPTIDPTPTRIAWATPVPTGAPNLLLNPSFEPPYTERAMRKILALHWSWFECDGCPAPRRGSGNPDDLVMGSAEFVPAARVDDPLRWRSGTNAQQFFSFYWAYRGGVWQTVPTEPGQICEAGAWVQSWSDNGVTHDPHRSWLDIDDGLANSFADQDLRANSTWYVIVALDGVPDFERPPEPGVFEVSRGFGYDDHIYDQWARIVTIFEAAGPFTTIGFENVRIWPFAQNDNYIDDAYVRCF